MVVTTGRKEEAATQRFPTVCGSAARDMAAIGCTAEPRKCGKRRKTVGLESWVPVRLEEC